MPTERYTVLRKLRNGEVVVFDHKIKDFVLFTFKEWETKKSEKL